jgi:hypothetical protein
MGLINQLFSLVAARTTVKEYSTSISSHNQSSQDDLLSIALDASKTYRVDGNLFFTPGTGESAGPKFVAALIQDVTNGVVLGKFSQGPTDPIDPTRNAFELFGTVPFSLKVAGTAQIKLQVWGLVGTGGGATYQIQSSVLVQELAG